MQITANQFQQLFLEQRPLLDVRAEVEYERGSFPGAVNIPILNNAERERVGIIYKNEGPEAATSAGYEMVSGETKQARITAWCEFLESNPSAYLYCFRGGQRSSIAAEWLKDSGINIPRIEGGYKALRNFLIAGLERWSNYFDPCIIGGKTGTGKTVVLNRFEQSVDLEGLANHRGSAFGKRMVAQPGQINFENSLAIKLLSLHHSRRKLLLLEDEGKLIGRLKIPSPLYDHMGNGQLVIVEAKPEDRARRIYDEYILAQWNEYRVSEDDEEHAFQKFGDYLLTGLAGISKRLGGLRYAETRTVMEKALQEHKQGNPELHLQWISTLLAHYYDPMYDYQLSKKQERIVFTGSALEVEDYLTKIINSC
jgi:tRNA 2-selenouridine synthase